MQIDVGERVLIHFPLVIFCIIVSIIGVLGNCLILHIFSHKVRVPVYSVFLRTMALLDLTNSLYTVPMIIFFKIMPDIQEVSFCEYLTFIDHFSTLTTGLIYVAIAVLRYEKVCHPRGYQMMESTAKRVTAGCIVFSVLVSLPILFLITNVDMSLVWKSDQVEVPMCKFHSDHKESKIAVIFSSWLCLEMSVISSTLVILYWSIRKVIKDIGNASVQSDTRKHVKTPPVFVTLAIVYLITNTPMVFLCVYYSFVSVNPNLSYILLTLLDISVYLPFINCLVNPIVYSFSWKTFRREVKKLCTRKRTLFEDSSTQQTSV